MGLCKTVTCELIKSQRPFWSWMAFPFWHERGSLEAPSRRWPWRLAKCRPPHQTGYSLESGQHLRRKETVCCCGSSPTHIPEEAFPHPADGLWKLDVQQLNTPNEAGFHMLILLVKRDFKCIRMLCCGYLVQILHGYQYCCVLLNENMQKHSILPSVLV